VSERPPAQTSSPRSRARSGNDSEPCQRPDWFAAFLADRESAKPSPHTVRAYCQDFDRLAALIRADRGGDNGGELELADITTNNVRGGFARYARHHKPASIRRCWSTWNALCTFLFREDLIPTNPMSRVRRPKADAMTPKSLSRDTVEAVLAAIAADSESDNPRVWVERDQAMVLTCLLAGLRTEELVQTNVGDVQRTSRGTFIHVRGKNRKERNVPIENPLVEIIERYLDSRGRRFPRRARRSSSPAGGLDGWPSAAPLFVGVDGERISRETLQYRVLRAFKRAGDNGRRPPGALLHAFRHTFATELANADVNVYTLRDLLGHESIATSQRYVEAAGAETRAAAAKNPLYEMLGD
jgi:site-specific recombinase XerD